MSPRRARSLFAPEVVQTSAMDCGPASLKCLLEGFGVPVSYGRLREACQTDVDGTSIDTLEEVAVQLGLHAEQVMIPVDHLLLDSEATLPAIVVVRLPNGFTHFVVVWRAHGPLIQVMDPAAGRRWIPRDQFLQEVYVHETAVPADAFAEWVGSDDFLAPLGRRLGQLAIGGEECAGLVAAARSGGWPAVARLDAATRMVSALVKGGGLRAGGEAQRLIAAALVDAEAIPTVYFTARPDPESPPEEPRVRLRGAVVLRASGAGAPPKERPLIPELAQALSEPPARPLRTLLGMLRGGGLRVPAALLAASALAAAGALVEATLLRASLDLPKFLGTVSQRLGAALALGIFVGAVRLVEGPAASGALRIGRQLELRLRQAFLEKLPRLGDRYLHSRPISDMAERAHAIHQVRELPDLASRLVRAGMEMAVTGGALAWLYPSCAAIALFACAAAALVPLLWQPVLFERDMRVRSHNGALARLALDALLGLMPVRTHAAERAVRREHEALLVEWSRASRSLLRAAAWADTAQWLATAGAVAWMVVHYVTHTQETRGVLLLTYWGLYLQALGEEVGSGLRQLPGQRNASARLLEPLGALDETSDEAPPGSPPGLPSAEIGAAIELQGVGVVAGGHSILRGLDMRIAPGEQVAIVGPSGAGKSSLVGLLLGWHRAAVGSVRVDGEVLSGRRLEAMRLRTAWVDPAVQLWNRSLLDNLRYGTAAHESEALAQILESANLQPLLDRLPEGLQTPLGEGGALVSGGEGQRVRLGRAMMRRSARLVILDEPFRGLDRDRRRELLQRARSWWPRATVLCITHDIAETRDFPRVLVVEGGQIAEDGDPAQLAADPASRYSALLASERELLETSWGQDRWRRIRMQAGRIAEEASEPAPPRERLG